jgi:hypothetical protein
MAFPKKFRLRDFSIKLARRAFGGAFVGPAGSPSVSSRRSRATRNRKFWRFSQVIPAEQKRSPTRQTSRRAMAATI